MSGEATGDKVIGLHMCKQTFMVFIGHVEKMYVSMTWGEL